MTRENCILTTKDFTILEIMLERRAGASDRFRELLRRKLASAIVVFRDDVPADVATLSSRLTYSVNGGDRQTRILTHAGGAAAVGLFLPITTLRGLALLGLAEGEELRLETAAGAQEAVRLHAVHYQPEAARREAEAASDVEKPRLRLVGRPARCLAPVGPISHGFDDPGPSAA